MYTNTANTQYNCDDLVPCIHCGKDVAITDIIASVHGSVCLSCDIDLDKADDDI